MADFALRLSDFPAVRGRITEDAPLGEVGWFRCGGRADVLFKPADAEDLATFLEACPADAPVTVLGVMSNTIVRDGGVRGVVIRLGREFAGIEALSSSSMAEVASFSSISDYVKLKKEEGQGERTEAGQEQEPVLRFIRAGAAALDGNVAAFAAREGIAGLEFLSGIPGTIGGALRMNAGAYGTELKDVLVEAQAVDRAGTVRHMTPEEMGMGYRRTAVPGDYIFTGCILRGAPGDPEAIGAAIADIKEKRGAAQPVRERTGGSTFANPSAEELAAAGLPEGTRAWQLVDRVGGRGLKIGGAQMSEKHANFMINTGGATAADLEELGEEIRRRVKEETGLDLRWEIKRIGAF